MGYRSDVVIAFAFRTKEQIDEAMAIYRMDPRVQEHDLEKVWTVRRWGEVWGLTYEQDHIKWYDNYNDVGGIMHMLRVVQDFDEQRGGNPEDGGAPLFPYAYRIVRVGEDDTDIEQDQDYNDSDLENELWDRIGILREINTSF